MTPFPHETEVRAAVRELRTAGRRLEGWASLFNVETFIGDTMTGFRETVKPGAFRSSIGTPGADILCLVDHDPTRVLGRTKTGSLTLSEHAKGLAFSCVLPATGYADDILALVTRGDAGGASIGFTVPPGGDTWDRRAREITNMTLFEVSIVSAFPAVAGTNVTARARCYADPAREREIFLSSI